MNEAWGAPPAVLSPQDDLGTWWQQAWSVAQWQDGPGLPSALLVSPTVNAVAPFEWGFSATVLALGASMYVCV